MALGYAAIALVVLAVFLPVAMVWQQRRSALTQGYQVRGGNTGLAIAALSGAVIIGAQLLQMVGIVPAIG